MPTDIQTVSSETGVSQSGVSEDDQGNESGTVNKLPHVQNEYQTDQTLIDSFSLSFSSSLKQSMNGSLREVGGYESDPLVESSRRDAPGNSQYSNRCRSCTIPSTNEREPLLAPSSNRTGTLSASRQSLLGGIRRQPSVPVRYIAEPTTEEVVYQPFSFWHSTRQQKLLLIAMASVDFSSYMCLSILAPFFPEEASRKGVNNTTSGWIFGIFALVQFVASPFFGKMLPKVGARFLLLAGQFFAGGCTVLFGVLDYISIENGPDLFIIYCFVLRAFLALGCAASGTASFAITASAFPDNVGTVFGLLETFTGLGLMVGPALGGVLYEYGGFVSPFAVLGFIMLITVPLNLCILPKQEDGSSTAESGSIFQLLRIPSVFITSLAVVVGTLVWAILDPTLQPHLSQFDLTPTIVGLIFLLMSAFYAIFSPIWGYLADRMKDSTPLLILGFLGAGIGLLLLGPSPILGFAISFNELWLNLVALIILGTCSSLAVIPTFDKIIDACDHAGIEDTLGMYSVVAGLWSSFYALGDFLGPSVGGFLVDYVGFEWTMTYVAFTCTAMAFILTILCLWEKKFGPTPMWGTQPQKSHQNNSNSTDGCNTLQNNSISPYPDVLAQPAIVVTTPNERTPLLAQTVVKNQAIVNI